MSIDKVLEQLVINTGRIADALEKSDQVTSSDRVVDKLMGSLDAAETTQPLNSVDEKVPTESAPAKAGEKVVKEKPKKPAAKKKAAPPPPKKEPEQEVEEQQADAEVYTHDEMNELLQQEYQRIRDAQPIKEAMKRDPFNGVSLADIDESLYPRLLREVRALPSAAV